MAELKLIHGKKSIKYDHFREFNFESCRAVCARLMGVCALKVTWHSRTDRRERMYQIIHLDYSEYGIDDYQEFICTPGSEDFSDKRTEMTGLWNQYVAAMGSELVSIDPACMLRLIEDALPLASEDIRREYDSDENREFRAYARMRLAFMRDELGRRGIFAEDCGTEDAIRMTSPLKLSAYETINYFLMRLVDCDFDAAEYLSVLSREELPESELTGPGIQTLCRCDIERSSRKKDPSRHGSTFPFRCRITTLAKDSYYYYSFVIWLSGGYNSKNPVVMDLAVGSVIRLSDLEAAIQISRTEYITVFDCKDEMLNGFDPKYIGPFANSAATAVPNGWLYTSYKSTNSHVDTTAYRMSDDVYGYALLTIAGELVLMSNDFRNISMIDDSVIFSLYSPYISTKGRYHLDTPVFHALCNISGAVFDELVEPAGD